MNFVPSSIGLTSCGLRILCQRFSAIASNLNAMVSPLARDPAPFVTRWRRRTVATVDAMTPLNFDLSSSGCETRPARGEPARAGSEPCDGLGNEADEA